MSGSYIDEGISGLSTRHRERFNDMISDGVGGKFDLILTKEISRFARNTLDSISKTRELLSHHVGVYFISDNINTLDQDAELRLTIMSGFAQDESRKISSRVKFGFQQSFKRDIVIGNNRIRGYTKDHGRLVIDEEEAKFVRQLFEMYATGKYSSKQLSRYFTEKGIRSENGRPISHTTLSRMIENPKYKGWYCANKTRVVDMFTKKAVILPKEEWVMHKDETGEIVPAIVSEQLWERANAVLEKRSDDVKNRRGICNNRNIFTGKLWCTHCNTPFYKRDGKNHKVTGNRAVNVWYCKGRIANGASSCGTRAIYEDELVEIIKKMMEDARSHIDEYVNDYLNTVSEIQSKKSAVSEIEKIQSDIKRIDLKKLKLLQYNLDGVITDDDFARMNSACEKERENFEKDLFEAKETKRASDNVVSKIDDMKKFLASSSEIVIDEKFVDTFIDKIYVAPEVNNSMSIKIGLYSGDNYEAEIHTEKRFRSATMVNPFDDG